MTIPIRPSENTLAEIRAALQQLNIRVSGIAEVVGEPYESALEEGVLVQRPEDRLKIDATNFLLNEDGTFLRCELETWVWLLQERIKAHGL